MTSREVERDLFSRLTPFVFFPTGKKKENVDQHRSSRAFDLRMKKKKFWLDQYIFFKKKKKHCIFRHRISATNFELTELNFEIFARQQFSRSFDLMTDIN